MADVLATVLRGEKGDWDGKEVLRLPVGADAWALVMGDTFVQGKMFKQWRDISESTSTTEAKETLVSLGFLKDVDEVSA